MFGEEHFYGGKKRYTEMCESMHAFVLERKKEEKETNLEDVDFVFDVAEIVVVEHRDGLDGHFDARVLVRRAEHRTKRALAELLAKHKLRRGIRPAPLKVLVHVHPVHHPMWRTDFTSTLSPFEHCYVPFSFLSSSFHNSHTHTQSITHTQLFDEGEETETE